ncbi:hypothetical protein [Paenibacillus silvae]|uniref:Uncharacterized protein n=1 Tax=Paenibacillus silvae TaxID=1325358 RepID=A0A2W6NMN6_9BACL|nr:hypothetical protein [Paenibacillus silvae]PZT57061.1 hypothetical protein DN757_03895 [Paenibacillus silvae]
MFSSMDRNGSQERKAGKDRNEKMGRLGLAWLNVTRIMFIGGVVVICAAALTACTTSSIEQERKLYNGQATTEGNFRAKQQGHGLNGALARELTAGFDAKHIKLMNNMFEDDGDGGMTYMYLLNGSARHIIKVHIYRDAQTRAERMEEMYGERRDHAVLENALGKTTIRSQGHVSFVYTASGGEKDVYEQDVMQVFGQVLGQLGQNK